MTSLSGDPFANDSFTLGSAESRFVPEVRTGGLLGNRRIFQDENGTWRHESVGAVSELMQGVSEHFLETQCIPLEFFREELHSRRTALVDEMTPEQQIALSGEDLKLHHNGRLISEHAQGQLASLAGVPTAFYKKVVAPAPDGWNLSKLAALNVNQGLIYRRRTVRGAREGNLRLRYRSEVCRAVLTDTYAVYDNHHLMDSLSMAFQPNEVSQVMVSHLWTDGDDIIGNVLIPDSFQRTGQDVFGLGFQFKNSEVGRKSVSLYPFLYDAITNSGIVFTSGNTLDGVIDIRHYGDITQEQVTMRIRDNMLVIRNTAAALLQQLTATRSIPIQEPQALLTAVGKRFGVSETASALWYQNFLREATSNADGLPSHRSVYGIIHALMITTTQLTGESRADLEDKVGRILSSSLRDTRDHLLRRWQQYAGFAQRLMDTHPMDIYDYCGLPRPNRSAGTPRTPASSSTS